jgi:hypothetical protein
MARIELRHTNIRMKDGLAGTATVDDDMVASEQTTLDIENVVLNTTVTDRVPIGARFIIAGETGSPIHVVTARTPAEDGPTTEITFTPALAMGVMDEAVITFQPQEIDIKIGNGNVTYTENMEYEYELDRGDLDTVREGDAVPLDVSLEFVYEFITTGTGENITPLDALKRKGGAAEWVSTDPDLCAPYAVDIEILHQPPCGTAQREVTLFPEFRRDSINPDLGAATVAVQGRCNVTEPVVYRETIE